MTDRKQIIQDHVEETLRCLDEIETLESDPFFYTRLHARLESIEEPEFKPGASHLVVRALRPACIMLLVALNVATAFLLFEHDRYQAGDRKASIMALAEHYSLFEGSYGNTIASGRD